MDQFHAAIRSPKTREQYELWLRGFLEFTKTDAPGFVRAGKADPKRAEGRIMAYIGAMKEKSLKPATIRARLAPIKLLLEMNDVAGVNWKKVGKVIPHPTVAEDRAPTVEEVRAIAGDTDFRLRVGVLFMATGGLRVGAFAGLKIKHVEPIERGGKVLAARVKVYPGSREEYSCFVSPEAWGALESYTAHRRENGEKITGESPVLRNRYGDGDAGKAVVPITPKALTRLLEHRYRRVGLRTEKKKRHEFARAHGFRKFFKSRAEQAMKPLNVEMLLGHETGLAGRYYRPQEAEILEDYLKALPSLAILVPQPSMEAAERLKALEEEVAVLKVEKAAVRPDVEGSADLIEALAVVLKANPAMGNELRRVIDARRAGNAGA